MQQPSWQQGIAEPRSLQRAACVSRALVVDLEGALLRSDLLQEALFSDVRKSLACLGVARSGSAERPGNLIAGADIDYAHLPYDPDVLNLVLVARAQGRKVYLAATRFRNHAAAIASHLGLDGAVMTADLSLAGDASDEGATALPFDSRNFDYVGNCRADRAVWRMAASAHVVGASDAAFRTLKQVNPHLQRIRGRHVSWRTWLNALRVHQYAKNTLVFVPALTSHQAGPAALTGALLAFLAFSACASSAYLLNDLLDLAADRHHPGKRHRAIASGDLPISGALLTIPALWLVSAVAGLCISPAFLAVLVAYLGATIAYSLFLKRKMLVDIVTLAGLYTIRIVGGAVAIGVYLSEWLLMFSLFIFTSLALIKRYSELIMRRRSGLPDPVNRDYRIDDLQIVAAMAAASGMNAVIVFSLYASSSAVAQMYGRPWMLWLVNPLLLYWLGRALMMAHREALSEDPIIYTFRDSASRIAVAMMMCIVLGAI